MLADRGHACEAACKDGGDVVMEDGAVTDMLPCSNGDGYQVQMDNLLQGVILVLHCCAAMVCGMVVVVHDCLVLHCHGLNQSGTELLVAAEEGNLAAMEMMLAKGVDFNTKDRVSCLF